MNYLLSILMLVLTFSARAEGTLTILGVDIYPAPGVERVSKVDLKIEDGKISSISKGASSASDQVIDGSGLTASFGFWNSHVHFTDPRVREEPQDQLDNMLLRYGFTQVLDTGSYLLETLQLKRAILDQTLRGPEIFTANGSFVYRDGTPAYLPPDLKLPEAVTPAIGASLTQQFLAQGADGIKIFSGSFQTPTHTIYLPVDVIKAITDTAHSMDSFVVSHPTTVQGLNNAVEGGVDVIAHTTSSGHEIADHILRQMQDNDIALIPTLSLWRYEMMKHTGNKNIADAVEADAISQMKQLLTANVEILFGTDVGYMTQYDTTREYQLMQRAGMSWPLIHHALTVGPAARFSEGRAVLEEGGKANIVLFEGDPAKDITALSRVAYTIIDGKIVYRRAE